MKRYVFCSLFAATLAVGGNAYAATPAPESPALVKLQQMVDNLGYDTTLSPDGTEFKFPWQGNNYSYTIHFSLLPNQTLAYAYVDLLTYNQTQLTKLNYVKLLELNDTGDFYFSMEKGQDGKSEELYANSFAPVNGLTPEGLRVLLQRISDQIDNSGNVWDSSLWK
jgi:hypothetical protein